MFSGQPLQLLLLLLLCSADNRFNVQGTTAYPYNHHHNRITITIVTIIITIIIIIVIIVIIIAISFTGGAPELPYGNHHHRNHHHHNHHRNLIQRTTASMFSGQPLALRNTADSLCF
jgi:heme/copper-type cytochrome/quinol oxidase subunit 2